METEQKYLEQLDLVATVRHSVFAVRRDARDLQGLKGEVGSWCSFLHMDIVPKCTSTTSLIFLQHLFHCCETAHHS